MLTDTYAKPISFKDIVTHGSMRVLFITVIVMLVASFSSWGTLFALAPTNVSASTESSDYDIEVRDTTVQPVAIAVSHTFVLTTSSGSMEFDVDDGVYLIYYNISVLTPAFDQVFGQDGTLMAPMIHEFTLGDTSDTEVITDTFDLDIAPGKYLVRIESSHPVELKVTQKYTYQGVMDGMLALGILSIIILIGAIIAAFKKRDAARRSASIGAFSQGPAPPAPSYYYGGGSPGPGPSASYGGPALPSVEATPPAPAYPGAPLPGSGGPSSLEFVPGGFYAEVMCTSCGRIIRNPPVYGVVTCEHCGAQGRLY